MWQVDVVSDLHDMDFVHTVLRAATGADVQGWQLELLHSRPFVA